MKDKFTCPKCGSVTIQSGKSVVKPFCMYCLYIDRTEPLEHTKKDGMIGRLK
jgi:endogenous inhibitor of DNA gyrase (YacG/DUF329 family)